MRVAGYEDFEEIGRGGFAVVYRAHQPAFGRLVAIKVLNASGLTDRDARRFEREALAMGRLSWHPNIVVVHDAGTTSDGDPYLAMEHLEGGSLGDHLEAHGPLDATTVLEHGVHLAGALHTAHEAGMLHRDVKPDNVLLGAFGHVKLADFGIAGLVDSSLTATGTMTATIAHAAPEVLDGRRASPSSDVYSLGSTLYELLTGEAAFVRATDDSIWAVIARVGREPVPDLRDRAVPDPVADVIETAMAKVPGDRPGSALELGRALQDAQRAMGTATTDLPVRGLEPAPITTVAADPTGPAGPISSPVEGPSASGHDAELPDEVTADETVVVAGGAVPAPGVRPQEHEHGRVARSPSRKVLLMGALAGVAVLAGIALAAALALSSRDGADAPAATSTAEAGEVVDTIAVGESPFGIAVRDEVVWVTTLDQATGPGSVTRIDAGSGNVLSTAPAGAQPVDVAADAEGAWVTNREDSSVTRLDPDGEVVDTLTVGQNPFGVLLDGASAWITSVSDRSLLRVDRATGETVDTIRVGANPLSLTEADGSIWVASFEDGLSGTVTRVAADSGQVTDTIEVGAGSTGIAAAGDHVWVASQEASTVSQLDVQTGEVLRTVEVPDPQGVAADEQSVWVASFEVGTVTRLDLTSGEVVGTVQVGGNPTGVAIGGGFVWVTNQADATVSKISPV